MATPSEVSTTPEQTLFALHNAVHSYLSLVRATAGALGEICPQVGAPFHDRLLGMQRRLAFDSSPQAIEQNHEEIERQIAECTSQTGEYMDQIWRDVQSVLGVVTRSADAIATRNAFYNNRLRQFAQDMGSRAVEGDPEVLDQTRALDANGLESCVESMSNESEEMLSQFRFDVQALATKLEGARVATSMDPETGVLTRREMERKLVGDSASLRTRTILRFEITGFDKLIGRLGESLAATIRKEFAARLIKQVRPDDVIGQWGPAQFVVLFRSSPDEALPRARQIAQALGGVYMLGGEATVEIEARDGTRQAGRLRNHRLSLHAARLAYLLAIARSSLKRDSTQVPQERRRRAASRRLSLRCTTLTGRSGRSCTTSRT